MKLTKKRAIMKDLTELRCSNCKTLIGALGQMHNKKPFCYVCAHKLGYWKPLPVSAVMIINGKTVNDPTRRLRKPAENAPNQNLVALNTSNHSI